MARGSSSTLWRLRKGRRNRDRQMNGRGDSSGSSYLAHAIAASMS
jgi:hypothetical protein